MKSSALLKCVIVFLPLFSQANEWQRSNSCSPTVVAKKAQQALDEAQTNRGRQDETLLAKALIEIRDNCLEAAQNDQPDYDGISRICKTGTVINPYGDAVYSDTNMVGYLGRVSYDARLELLSNRLHRNLRYPADSTDLVYVRIISTKNSDLNGKTGYVSARHTDFPSRGCVSK